MSSPILQNNCQPLIAPLSKPLRGEVEVCGDKSISHRALMLATIADGTTIVSNLLEAEDIFATKTAMQALGAGIRKENGKWHIDGTGNGCLLAPDKKLDFGNSGTGARLTMGLVASYDFSTCFVGDQSLSARPMARVLQPLQKIGTQIISNNEKLPITITGVAYPLAIEHYLQVPSAQVKSALLLAALNIAGTTTIIEPILTRDHTERMLHDFGAEIKISQKNNQRHISLSGQRDLQAQTISIAGDPSAAAFLIVAALIVPQSEIIVKNVLMNPTRIGFLKVLKQMGGDIEYLNCQTMHGEPICDIKICSSKLQAVEVASKLAPSMIDEYPILFVAAAFANGTSKFYGLQELRIKESDRLNVMAKNLKANGVNCQAGDDYLFIEGANKITGGGDVKTHLDHRIAMSCLVLGMASQKPIRIDDANVIDTSFPNFIKCFNQLGTRFENG